MYDDLNPSPPREADRKRMYTKQDVFNNAFVGACTYTFKIPITALVINALGQPTKITRSTCSISTIL